MDLVAQKCLGIKEDKISEKQNKANRKSQELLHQAVVKRSNKYIKRSLDGIIFSIQRIDISEQRNKTSIDQQKQNTHALARYCKEGGAN